MILSNRQSTQRTKVKQALGPNRADGARNSQQLMLFFLGFFLIISLSAQAQTSSSSHVGFVNLNLVYDNLQSTIDVKKELANQQSQLDQLVSFHHVDQKEKDAPVDLHEQELRVKMLRTQTKQLARANEQIQAAVAEIAKEKRLDLVMVGTSPELPDNAEYNMTAQALGGLILNRSIIYAADGLDLSAQTIALVNKDYHGPTTTAAPLPMTTLKVGSRTYELEIAGDEPNWERGLMERDSMPADHGMIFVFPDLQNRAFWMHHTRFDLDLLFVDDHGKVVSAHSTKAYDDHSTLSEFPAKYVVELSAGAIAGSGIKAGDVLTIPPAVDAALKK